MKQLRYEDRVWMVGDEIASLMMDLSAALAKVDSAEHVKFRALDPNGHETEVEFLLGPATMMVAEPVEVTDHAEPDNDALQRKIRERIDILTAVGSDAGLA